VSGPEPAARGSWTSLELVKWTADYFARAGIETARLDAEVLLAHVLGCGRLDLYLQFERPVEASERARYRELIQRRGRDRVPVAQLTGEREFWSRSFLVTEDVLIPRPESELLIEVAVRQRPERALDFGVGSGNLATALALELPAVEVLAVDCSEAALEVAGRNFDRHGVSDRVSLLQAQDLSTIEGDFDLIVSNPPYIATADIAGLAPELAHEPRVALDGGPDGLRVVRQLLAEAPERLRSDGQLLMEIGADQADAVRSAAEGLGGRVETHRDLAGIERVVAVRFDRASRGGTPCPVKR